MTWVYHGWDSNNKHSACGANILTHCATGRRGLLVNYEKCSLIILKWWEHLVTTLVCFITCILRLFTSYLCKIAPIGRTILWTLRKRWIWLVNMYTYNQKSSLCYQTFIKIIQKIESRKHAWKYIRFMEWYFIFFVSYYGYHCWKKATVNSLALKLLLFSVNFQCLVDGVMHFKTF